MKKEKSKKVKTKNQAINLDNEVIIGLNTKPIEKKASKKKPTKKKKKNVKINKKKDFKKALRRYILLLILLLIAVMLVLLSSIFNCKTIVVVGNNKISSDTIIALSNIKTEENMFKISSKKVRESIKQGSAYINKVKLKRKIDGTVEIHVEERNATYMITYGEGCAYINNQGYILEFSEFAINEPMIIGFKTDLSTKKAGDRLENDDLVVLEKIIKITDIAKLKNLKDKITYINVSNVKNIQIYMDTEKKMINLGNENDINKKIDRLTVILEQEQGNEGEIFIQDINNIYFRKKV
ncbi:MAG: cell division protein FtsQ/DivIB [Clostridia bacterium]